MAKLTGQSIASSYDQLLIVDDANGISASLQAVESADTGGSSSALKIATNKIILIINLLFVMPRFLLGCNLSCIIVK